MDQTALVSRDIRVGNEIIARLGAGGVDIEDALWVYSPQIDEWRLFIASPLVDRKGPIAAYKTVLRAFREAGVLDDVPYRRISLLSPTDPTFARLRASFVQQSRKTWGGAARILGGHGSSEEAYVYEGSLHIVRVTRSNGQAGYRVMFAPYKGPGGAMPAAEYRDEQSFRAFLIDQVGISESTYRSVLDEVQARGTAFVPNVLAKEKDLKRWGLLSLSK